MSRRFRIDMLRADVFDAVARPASHHLQWLIAGIMFSAVGRPSLARGLGNGGRRAGEGEARVSFHVPINLKEYKILKKASQIFGF